MGGVAQPQATKELLCDGGTQVTLVGGFPARMRIWQSSKGGLTRSAGHTRSWGDVGSLWLRGSHSRLLPPPAVSTGHTAARAGSRCPFP